MLLTCQVSAVTVPGVTKEMAKDTGPVSASWNFWAGHGMKGLRKQQVPHWGHVASATGDGGRAGGSVSSAGPQCRHLLRPTSTSGPSEKFPENSRAFPILTEDQPQVGAPWCVFSAASL